MGKILEGIEGIVYFMRHPIAQLVMTHNLDFV